MQITVTIFVKVIVLRTMRKGGIKRPSNDALTFYKICYGVVKYLVVDEHDVKWYAQYNV
jgi:hypothetical protein